MLLRGGMDPSALDENGSLFIVSYLSIVIIFEKCASLCRNNLSLKQKKV